MATILIVEDDYNLARTIALCLRKSDGYSCCLAHTGEEGLRLFERSAPDAVILDLMLPGIGGLEVCARMRELSLRRGLQSPAIVILSAKSEIPDRVTGYTIGADVYLAKPFEPSELAACVQAQLRRLRQLVESRQKVIQTAHFRIDFERSHVEKRHSCVSEWVNLPLTSLQIKVLAALASFPGRVWSRDQLIEKAWEPDFEGSDEAVRSCIKLLRKKLSDDTEKFIKTVSGMAYKFEDADED